MAETRLVRRRKRIPDQASPVSTQEQARLLNDPAVPISNVHTSAEQTNDDSRGVVGAPSQRSSGNFQNEKAA